MVIYALIAALLLALLPSSAHAYIDPGTGAMVAQMLLAAIATAMVTIKLWWWRLLNILRKARDAVIKPADQTVDKS